ncbi:MAG TPA: TetR/AcrR family transcriptional regulator [Ktedonobacteraceae bacterium]
MSRRPDSSEIRRNQILDAATKVFVRLGFQHARMDDIVEESGLSKGTLYWYFKSKEDIINAISRRLFTGELEKLEGLLEAEGTVSERLMQLTKYRVAGLKRMSNLVPIIFEFYAVAVHQQWVKQFIGEYFKHFRALLEDLIQQGIDRGEFYPVNAAETAISLASMYEGLTIHWLMEPETVQWDILSENSIPILLNGLKVRP